MSKRKSRKTQSISLEDSKSVSFWLVMGFVILFMLIAPYYKALFNGGQWTFEGPIYRSIMWTSAALLVISIYLFKRWKLNDHRDILGIVIWFIPLSYFISAISAASPHEAMNGAYIHVMYAVFFLIGLYFTRSKLGMRILVYAIVGSGYLYVIYGFMNWFGNANYQDAVYGGRLSNVFQYPNTYSALLIGLLFSSMILAGQAKKWYAILIYAIAFVPTLLSFLLTSSRGGLLVIPVVLVISLLLMTLSKQINQLIYLGTAGVVSLLIIGRINQIGTDARKNFTVSAALAGWIYLIVSAIVVSLVIILWRKYIEPLIEKKIAKFLHSRIAKVIIPFGIIVLTIIGVAVLFGSPAIQELLPATIQTRLTGIGGSESSIFSRNVFYQDALRLIRDHPVFGVGGGAWSSLYQAYQSYAYTSNQAHNFLLQYVVEVGLLGFAILLIFIAYVVFNFLRRINNEQGIELYHERQALFLIAIAILLHSIIDFDMSFVYIGALVFLCLGGVSSIQGKEVAESLTSRMNKWKLVVPAGIAVISIIMIVNSIRLYQGNNLFNSTIEASRSSGDYNKITAKLDSALKYSPHNPVYEVTKISLLNQVYQQSKDEHFKTEALDRIVKLIRREPYDRVVLNEVSNYYITNGMWEEANELISSKLSKMVWDINLYEKMISIQAQWGIELSQKSKNDLAIEHLNQTLQIYAEVLQKREQIDAMASSKRDSGYMFRVTPQIALSAGQALYMMGDYQEASNVLAKGRVSNDLTLPMNRDVARWYIASLQKQGKDDKALYNKLIEADTGEAVTLQIILSLGV